MTSKIIDFFFYNTTHTHTLYKDTTRHLNNTMVINYIGKTVWYSNNLYLMMDLSLNLLIIKKGCEVYLDKGAH